MVLKAKSLALGAAVLMSAVGAAAAAPPVVAVDVSPRAFAALAGQNTRDIVQFGRSSSAPSRGFEGSRGFYGDGFGYGFGGYYED